MKEFSCQREKEEVFYPEIIYLTKSLNHIFYTNNILLDMLYKFELIRINNRTLL
jgi:hypothetical protein